MDNEAQNKVVVGEPAVASPIAARRSVAAISNDSIETGANEASPIGALAAKRETHCVVAAVCATGRERLCRVTYGGTVKTPAAVANAHASAGVVSLQERYGSRRSTMYHNKQGIERRSARRRENMRLASGSRRAATVKRGTEGGRRQKSQNVCKRRQVGHRGSQAGSAGRESTNSEWTDRDIGSINGR